MVRRVNAFIDYFPLTLLLVGDGGGGPGISHLELLSRFRECKGLPRVSTSESPSEFFDNIERDFAASQAALSVPRWSGELYLELHQGTLTTQAVLKQLNRRCEMQLRSLEALFTICYAYHRLKEADVGAYQAQIRSIWKSVLLNQFHDVL